MLQITIDGINVILCLFILLVLIHTYTFHMDKNINIDGYFGVFLGILIYGCYYWLKLRELIDSCFKT